MQSHLNIKTILGFFLLVITFAIPILAEAQTSTSTGRSNVITETMSESDIRSIRKIRKLINEQKFNKVVNLANRLIKAESRRGRAGNSYSEFYYEAHNCVCVGLTGQGKNDEAMEACNTSIKLTPNHWESLKTRATLNYMAQNFTKSLDDFTRALINAPDDTRITNVLKQNIAIVKSKTE
mgnify:CR=1 FL=1